MDEINRSKIERDALVEGLNSGEVPKPRITKLLFKYLFSLILIYIFIIVLMQILHIHIDFSRIFEMGIRLLFLYALVSHLFYSGYNIEKTFRLYSIPRKIILPLILIAFGFALIGNEIEILVRLTWNYVFSAQIKPYDLGHPEYFWGWGLLFLFGALFAPIFEEFVFRGLLMSSIEAKYGIRKAIIYSTMIFAILHFHISNSISIAICFLLIGYIVYKTNSILSSIIIHMVNNIISLSFYPFYKGDNLDWIRNLNISTRIALELTVFIIGAVILIKGILWMNKSMDKSSQRPITFISDYFRRKNELCTTSSVSSETIDQ